MREPLPSFSPRSNHSAHERSISNCAEMNERVIHDNRDGVGEVEAAHARLDDRDAVAVLAPAAQELIAKPAGLASEDHEVSATIISLQVRSPGMDGKVLEARIAMGLLELGPSGVGAQINQRPVVQA